MHKHISELQMEMLVFLETSVVMRRACRWLNAGNGAGNQRLILKMEYSSGHGSEPYMSLNVFLLFAYLVTNALASLMVSKAGGFVKSL